MSLPHSPSSPDVLRSLDARSAAVEPPAIARGGRLEVGQEWALDVTGLDPARLAGAEGRRRVEALFDDLIRTLDLHPVGPPHYHVFPGPHAGVTGLVALSESHLACHTFPEAGGMTLNLYTCRRRVAPDWAAIIESHLGRSGAPARLVVHEIQRSLGGSPDPGPRTDGMAGDSAEGVQV